MKVGDYVRTPYGIRKVKDIRIKDKYLDDGFYVEDRFILCGQKAMQEVKSSPNIIDLIEVGDFIGKVMVEQVKEFDDGTRVIVMEDGFDEYDENEYFLKAGIVTREQFESMEYRIGD